LVTFGYLNLAEDQYPALQNNTQELDLILWRNVSIYLPVELSQQVARRFYECLIPNGWLVVGPSETNPETYHQFATIRLNGALLYQKSGQTPTPSLIPGVEQAQSALSQSQASFQGEDIANPNRKSFAALDALPTDEARKAPSGKSPAELFEAGKKSLRMKHFEEAKALFQACLELDPGFTQAFCQLARGEANLGRLGEAERWARQATESDPLHSEAHYILALIREEQGQPDEAMLELKKTIYLDSKFVLAYFSLSNLCQRSKQDKEAARYRSRGIQLAQNLREEDILPGSDDLTVKQLLNMHNSGSDQTKDISQFWKSLVVNQRR
jgi:chemotaxis protein methyltransferase CheR